ncbi:hypothetical protein BLOT_006090 [Blomia tropicalis]|nr:hypothetical protein BLOT_006090 [Blomia tropicalis]
MLHDIRQYLVHMSLQLTIFGHIFAEVRDQSHLFDTLNRRNSSLGRWIEFILHFGIPYYDHDHTFNIHLK